MECGVHCQLLQKEASKDSPSRRYIRRGGTEEDGRGSGLVASHREATRRGASQEQQVGVVSLEEQQGGVDSQEEEQ